MAGNAGRDFYFQIGSWRVAHRRLNARLFGCADWIAFEGTSQMRPILCADGNVEDNVMHVPGGPVRAIALRSFDPMSANSAIWRLDARAPHRLDAPVIGAFANGSGRFFAGDVCDPYALAARASSARIDFSSDARAFEKRASRRKATGVR